MVKRIDQRGRMMWLIRVFLVLWLTGKVWAEGGVLGEGTERETPWYVVKGEQAGPVVLITGGVHGDEPAGARAAEQIRHWKLERGTMIVIPRVNVAALKAGSRKIPGELAALADLNRVFPKKGEAVGDVSGATGTMVWEFIREKKPDWVIDLHEGYHFHASQPKSVGSTIIGSGDEFYERVAERMLEKINATIRVKGRKFQRLHLPVDGSLARAASEHLGCKAMILETTTREQALSLRVRQHRMMVREFLMEFAMLAEEAPMYPAPEDDGFAVAVYDDRGAGGAGPGMIEAALRGEEGVSVWRVGAEDLKEGALQGFDLVVFPGGSGSAQAKAIGEKGRDEVKAFVKEGGGYVGICAGAYLSAVNYEWSLGLSNHRTFCEMKEIPGQGVKSMWYRGPSAVVSMEVSEEGAEILGVEKGVFPVRYHNGPIVSPAGVAGLPEFRVLATFRSEVSRYDAQKGTMSGTPAIVATEFGKGRVLSISPHPEASSALRPMVKRALWWAGKKKP